MPLSIVPDTAHLEVRVIEGEPRVRDLDLAAAIGFERPRDIRKLIIRILNRNEVCATVAQTSDVGGRPGREYWLTEEEALLVVTKSETPKALEITRTIIRVFRAAVRGEVVPSDAGIRLVLDAIREQAAELASLRRDVDGMRQLSTGTEDSPHCIGNTHARRLLARIKSVATESSQHVAVANRQRLTRSLRKSFEIEVRARIGFDGAGTRWERLPSAKHAAAYLAIEAIADRENKRSKAFGPANQLALLRSA